MERDRQNAELDLKKAEAGAKLEEQKAKADHQRDMEKMQQEAKLKASGAGNSNTGGSKGPEKPGLFRRIQNWRQRNREEREKREEQGRQAAEGIGKFLKAAGRIQPSSGQKAGPFSPSAQQKPQPGFAAPRIENPKFNLGSTERATEKGPFHSEHFPQPPTPHKEEDLKVEDIPWYRPDLKIKVRNLLRRKRALLAEEEERRRNLEEEGEQRSEKLRMAYESQHGRGGLVKAGKPIKQEGEFEEEKAPWWALGRRVRMIFRRRRNWMEEKKEEVLENYKRTIDGREDLRKNAIELAEIRSQREKKDEAIKEKAVLYREASLVKVPKWRIFKRHEINKLWDQAEQEIKEEGEKEEVPWWGFRRRWLRRKRMQGEAMAEINGEEVRRMQHIEEEEQKRKQVSELAERARIEQEKRRLLSKETKSEKELWREELARETELLEEQREKRREEGIREKRKKEEAERLKRKYDAELRDQEKRKKAKGRMSERAYFVAKGYAKKNR
ncbi:hypothetical protein HY501_00810 [Candidatus Woesearchaeota archaeon]|nr:hypothetical protein [Candidatus Woesearchaeota archaeon]